MSNYIIKDGELRHYGVVGMRWGVRRASKRLSSASTREQKDKAIASLKKHKTKGSAKVAKLEKKHVRLEKKVDKSIIKGDVKVAKLKRKSTKKRNRAYNGLVFTGKAGRNRLRYKADALDAKAEMVKAKSDKAKAKLAKNEKMQELFNKELANIDKSLKDKGRKFING